MIAGTGLAEEENREGDCKGKGRLKSWEKRAGAKKEETDNFGGTIEFPLT